MKKINIYILNPPSKDLKSHIREGRCTQSGSMWSTIWPPFTLASIASIMAREGFLVKASDASVENRSIQSVISDILIFKTDLLIYSTGSPTIKSDLLFASLVKDQNPSIKIAVIGTHVTAIDKDILEKYLAIDFIIRNEPEYTCLELAKSLSGNFNNKEFSILGLSYRNGHIIIKNDDRPFVEDLDQLSTPLWSDFNLNNYKVPLINKKFLIISPHRGCNYNCTFCTTHLYYGNKVRSRSVDLIIDEINNLKLLYGINYFFFWADTFTYDKSFILELSTALRELEIHWFCNSRIDSIDEEMLMAMKESGCFMISYGVESISDEVLKKANKKLSISQVEHTLSFTKKLGLLSIIHIIIGLPGETLKTAKKTLDFVKTSKADFAQFYYAAPKLLNGVKIDKILMFTKISHNLKKF